MTDQPKTTAGRALVHGWQPQDEVYQAVLAIEAEAAAAAIWERLEAQPGFTEEMAQGEADIAAGKGTPFRGAAAQPSGALREALETHRIYRHKSHGWFCPDDGERFVGIRAIEPVPAAAPAEGELAHLRVPGGFVAEDMGTAWSTGDRGVEAARLSAEQPQVIEGYVNPDGSGKGNWWKG